MKLFVCMDCGKIFSNPRHYRDSHGFDSGPFEEWYGCPSCGGAYTEAFVCDECGEWITGGYIKTKNEQRICDNCYTTMDIGDED